MHCVRICEQLICRLDWPVFRLFRPFRSLIKLKLQGLIQAMVVIVLNCLDSLHLLIIFFSALYSCFEPPAYFTSVIIGRTTAEERQMLRQTEPIHWKEDEQKKDAISADRISFFFFDEKNGRQQIGSFPSCLDYSTSPVDVLLRACAVFFFLLCYILCSLVPCSYTLNRYRIMYMPLYSLSCKHKRPAKTNWEHPGKCEHNWAYVYRKITRKTKPIKTFSNRLCGFVLS